MRARCPCHLASKTGPSPDTDMTQKERAFNRTACWRAAMVGWRSNQADHEATIESRRVRIETDLGPLNSFVLIMDRSVGALPESMQGASVARTLSSVGIGMLPQHNSDTLITVADEIGLGSSNGNQTPRWSRFPSCRDVRGLCD